MKTHNNISIDIISNKKRIMKIDAIHGRVLSIKICYDDESSDDIRILISEMEMIIKNCGLLLEESLPRSSHNKDIWYA